MPITRAGGSISDMTHLPYPLLQGFYLERSSDMNPVGFCLFHKGPDAQISKSEQTHEIWAKSAGDNSDKHGVGRQLPSP